MRKTLGILFATCFIYSFTKAQCPPGASVTETANPSCTQGCAVVLKNWPAGVNVSVFSGTSFGIIGVVAIPGTYGIVDSLGNGFACVPCNLPLIFASAVPQSSNGCVLTSNITVPVTLSNFSVTYSGGNALLKWDVALEQGIVSYIIERSEDGVTFKDIATVEGSGITVIKKNYSYTDALIKSGTLYYKLKIVQGDGAISYSPVRSINNEAGLEIKVYPTPITGNSFNLNVPGNLLPASISIFDTQGRSIYETKINQVSSIINAPSTNGVYVLKIVGKDNSVVMQKIIKR